METICLLKDIYKALYSFEKEFASKNGITINEGMLLCCLKEGEAKTASDLHDFIGLSNSRISRIITTVENKNYIKRKMGQIDKRQMIFTLTKEGETKIKEMQSQDINFETLKEKIRKLIE